MSAEDGTAGLGAQWSSVKLVQGEMLDKFHRIELNF